MVRPPGGDPNVTPPFARPSQPRFMENDSVVSFRPEDCCHPTTGAQPAFTSHSGSECYKQRHQPVILPVRLPSLTHTLALLFFRLASLCLATEKTDWDDPLGQAVVSGLGKTAACPLEARRPLGC